MKKVLVSQFIILLAGTLFAWGNFGYELYNWLQTNKQVGCAIGASNPFFTPCFYGAIFFTVAFILSIVSLRKLSK
jgi:hypothetical protein